MAFRTKAPTRAALMCLAALTLGAAPQDYPVRHRHLRNGAPGILRIDDNSISFKESGKQRKHSRIWKYDDIQELTLGPDTLRILTYEDNPRELGRDRVYVFDRLPASLAVDWYPAFRAKLDARFVAALADDQLAAEWQVPAKLLHGRAGSQGILLAGPNSLVYKSAQPGESRTWRIADLENVSTSGPFDLTIDTHEREFRFQLKHPLADTQYQTLWMRVNRGRGLRILNTPG